SALAGAKEMIGAVRDIPVPEGIAAERRVFLDHMAKNEDVRANLARFLRPKEKELAPTPASAWFCQAFGTWSSNTPPARPPAASSSAYATTRCCGPPLAPTA